MLGGLTSALCLNGLWDGLFLIIVVHFGLPEDELHTPLEAKFRTSSGVPPAYLV